MSKPSIRIVSENDGATLRAMHGERCLASALLRRPYAKGPLFTLSRSNGADAGTADSGMEARRKLRQIAATYLAEMDAPASPVASDPVPADVPCYLAVSTDAAGVETVMGVFRVAEYGNAAIAEREARMLCERIRAATPLADCGVRWRHGKQSETDAAFAALDAAERALAAEPVTKPVRSATWSRAFDAREAAVKRAVSLDPIRFVRAYPSRAMAYRWLLPADMVARIEAAEDDAAMRAAVGATAMVPQVAQQQQARAIDRLRSASFGEHMARIRGEATGEAGAAPIMVPQPCQQQQGRDMRRGMARCEMPGEWQIGIWCVTRQPNGTWEARATGPGTMGDGSPHSYPTLSAVYLGLTGEPMPGGSRE